MEGLDWKDIKIEDPPANIWVLVYRQSFKECKNCCDYWMARFDPDERKVWFSRNTFNYLPDESITHWTYVNGPVV